MKQRDLVMFLIAVWKMHAMLYLISRNSTFQSLVVNSSTVGFRRQFTYR